MRRGACRDEADLLEPGELEHFLGKSQMPKMNRVEGPAQNADRLGAHRLQCKATNIRQHLGQKNDKARRRRTVDHAMVI